METSNVIHPAIADLSRLSSWDRLFVRALGNVRGGTVRITLPCGHIVQAGKGSEDSVDLVLKDPGITKRILLGGSMAFAEAYIDGRWTTSDLTALLKIMARSQERLGRFAKGTSALLRWMDGWSHKLRRNTKGRAKRNIREHYDLGNNLYRTFLDDSLTYSSALFAREGESLESAQFRKLDRLIDGLAPGKDDHVLEIGTGWGSCAIRMAQRTGCRVTSLTLSREQAEEARRRVEEAGLSGRVDIRLQDYRDVKDTFDHAVSIEMIEAVGHEFLPGYFRAVQERLRPGGRFALQAITIPDERYESYRKSCDFIRKHVFPGGHLPCPGQLRTLRERETRFQEIDTFEFGGDYAETLRRWRERFFDRLDTVREIGFDDAFIRKWHYYLAYCEAGFDLGLIHVRQIMYRMPEA